VFVYAGHRQKPLRTFVQPHESSTESDAYGRIIGSDNNLRRTTTDRRAQSANSQSSPWTHPPSRIGTILNHMKMTTDHLICKIAICKCPPYPVRNLHIPRAQSHRALLQQAQTLPPRRDPLRQARRQLPRHGSTRFNAIVDDRLWVHGPCNADPFSPPLTAGERMAQIVGPPRRAAWRRRASTFGFA
jgi:hypothetical protein